MKKTIISHFYNEEYLLPWWLNHHKKMFDHGILINYHSTDNSIDIIKQICPDWTIVDSQNENFDAVLIDKEIMQYEKNIIGWKISLNTTEFIVGNIDYILNNPNISEQLLIPSICFFDWNPNGVLDKNQKIWEQKNIGIDYKTDFSIRRARSLHLLQNINYPTGRHFETYNYEELLIFHFANCISSPEMLSRRLQIQYRIPNTDKKNKLGIQHYGNDGDILTEKTLYENFYMPKISLLKNQSEYIKNII